MSPYRYPPSSLVPAAIQTIRSVQNRVLKQVAADPEFTLRRGVYTDDRKESLTVDGAAEFVARYTLSEKLGSRYDLRFFGEEGLTEGTDPMVAPDHTGLLVLMDMIDGTDLLERGLTNWASALLFLDPGPPPEILAAFVGIPKDGVYFATADSDEVRKHCFRGQGKPTQRAVTGPSKITSLAEASVAFYGQKIKNFLSVVNHASLCGRLAELNVDRPKMRLFNFAGNPMMMRLIDGYSRIDAIFELFGQKPHDVVPGAYIAQKAGARLESLDGSSPNLPDLILHPATTRFRYVLASTQELASELSELLRVTP